MLPRSLFLFCSASLLATGQPASFAKAADQLLKEKNWPALKSLAEGEAERSPARAEPRVYLAIALANCGSFEVARSTFEQALALDPSNIPGWFNFGIFLADRKDAPGFRKAVATLAKLNPSLQLRLRDLPAADGLLFEDPLLVRLTTKEFQVKNQPFPGVYPPGAKERGIHGDVLLEFLVDTTGKPIRAEAIWGPAELKPMAQSYLLTWSFEPAMREGQPRPFVARMVMPFRLRDGGVYQTLPKEYSPR